MGERLIFEHADVRVTSARLVVGDRSHSMRGVTSVSQRVRRPHRLGWCIGLVAGVALILLAAPAGRIAGIALTGACAMVITRQRPIHAVVLNGTAGEVAALAGTDREEIAGVIAALNTALRERG